MGSFRFRRLEQRRIGGAGDRMVLSYQPPRSPSGKVYQYSPNPEAAPRLFLIGDAPPDRQIAEEARARMRREPGPGQTVCPYSGFVGNDEDFVHLDDIEAMKKQIIWEAGADIQDMLAEVARDFNRRQPSRGFITMKMEAKSSPRPRPLVIRADLLRDLECGICQRPYAVYAIALYCPDCGAPNLALHFDREKSLVNEEIAIADQQDSAGRAEIAYRLMGNAHEDVLTAFETALKTVYRHLVRRHLPDQAGALCTKKEIGNAFQNIERARDKFAVLRFDPFAALSDSELATLRINIHKRHVIGHNLGVADEHYVELTQDEQPGETVRLMGDEVRAFAELCGRVVAGLDDRLLPGGIL
jgi:hypothetical protein